MKRIIAPVLLAVLFVTLLVRLPMAIADRASSYEWFRTVQDIRHLLLESYVEAPDEEKLQQAIISGMIDTLEDPYTVYVPPKDTAAFNKDLRGTYAGIGAEVNLQDGFLVIVTPMDDSPSLRAGIRAGDVVLEIEGESTYELSINECIERLTGEAGTPVNVRVRHLDGTEADLTIIRGNIVTRTIKGLRRDGEDWHYCVDTERNVVYVRMTQFNAESADELLAALEKSGPDIGGMVLDLRDNPGGGLPTAIRVADMFLDEGIIVSVRPREGVGQPQVFQATAGGTIGTYPIVVLINGASASASEIVSGALQDNDRAVVLGTRSFGKGSVQEVRPLGYDGGTLKYTTAYYYLPNGRNISRRGGDADTWGVDPNDGYVVPITDDAARDRFLARRDYEIIKESNDAIPDCVEPDWIRENLKDEQLALAVETLRGRIDDGVWVPVNDTQADTAALAGELHRETLRRTAILEQLQRSEERIAALQQHEEVEYRDPWLDPEIDVKAGTITVRDKDGTVVGRYRIDGGNVALALESLYLTPETQEEDGAAPE